ncbi:MAG TPA: zinc ABC transporter substrate-binding protein [Kofleriaceae bacterium]|nr:zinc ABC transporter substrate-binding protein [Kofleriaceae bacterium]
MRPSRVPLFAVALLLLVAAACSGKQREPKPSPSPSPGLAPGPSPSPSPGPTPTPTPTPTPPAPGKPLRVGVTMHPYYSWTANIIAGLPDVTLVAVLPGEVDAGDYQPAPDDIAKIRDLDAIVVNGLGHDAFIGDMIKASGNDHLTVIDANAETPTVPFTHGTEANSHTFISFTNAIQETGYIARKLGELRPALADRFETNAQTYIGRLRAIRAAAADKLANAKIKKVVTVHDGYAYLLAEFGIELAGVVQPAHGLTPSAAELTDMIELMKAKGVTVVLTEETFPQRLLDTLQAATHAKVYIISHVAVGTYAPDEYERVMQRNADVLVKALVTDPT